METIINLILVALMVKSIKLLIKDFFYALLKEDVRRFISLSSCLATATISLNSIRNTFAPLTPITGPIDNPI